MKTAAVVVSAIALAAFAFFWLASGPSGPDDTTLARIAFRRDECRVLVDRYNAAGAITAVAHVADGIAVRIDAAAWDATNTRDHLAMALAVYCAEAPADGRITVTMRKADGEAVFRVVNGRVASW